MTNSEGKAVPKKKQTLFLQFDEESLQQRRDKKQGMLSLVQSAVVCAPPELTMVVSERVERMHFTSTTLATNVIQGIGVPLYDQLWLVNKKEKGNIIGGSGLVRAGGIIPDEEKTERPDLAEDRVVINV